MFLIFIASLIVHQVKITEFIICVDREFVCMLTSTEVTVYSFLRFASYCAADDPKVDLTNKTEHPGKHSRPTKYRHNRKASTSILPIISAEKC